MVDLVDNDPDDGTQIGDEKGHQPKVTNTSKIMEQANPALDSMLHLIKIIGNRKSKSLNFNI